MATISLDGEPPKATQRTFYLVPEDAYEGVFSAVGDPFDSTFTKGKISKTTRKVVFDCEIPNNKGEILPLPMYVNVAVTKAGVTKEKTYDNSKMYDIIEKAGALEIFREFYNQNKSEEGKLPDEMLVDFLKTNIIGRKAKFDVVTKERFNEDGTRQQYSVVNAVKRFLDIEPPVEEIDMSGKKAEEGKKEKKKEKSEELELEDQDEEEEEPKEGQETLS